MLAAVTDFGLSKRRRDILVKLIEQMSGGVHCIWDTEPDTAYDPLTKAKITLRVRSITVPDSWEKITTVNADGTYSTRIGNQNVATVELKIETYDTETYAHQLFLSITTRMYRDRYRAIMHDAGCSLLNNSDYTDLPTHYDNHVFSCGVGTLMVCTADLDPATDKLDQYVESLTISSSVTDGTNTWNRSTTVSL